MRYIATIACRHSVVLASVSGGVGGGPAKRLREARCVGTGSTAALGSVTSRVPATPLYPVAAVSTANASHIHTPLSASSTHAHHPQFVRVPATD